jgi:uncharacterized membrane protein YgcG
MFGSETLDVVIGLVLIFLLVSLLLTALTEIIESVLKTRAADLERAIRLMLADSDGTTDEAVAAFYRHPLVFALFDGDFVKSRKTLFFRRSTGGDLPSYIPRDLFSAVAVDLRDAGAAGSGLTAVVDTYRRLHGDDAAALKANLESWYDGVMDRASGWYKRRTQKLLFWLGLSLAVALNINPVVIGQHLAATPAARDAMVQLAAGTAEQREALTGGTPEQRQQRLRELDKSIRDVGLPMGWSKFARDRSFPHDKPLLSWAWASAILIALFGWLATAVAGTLGAPFWFDALNKLMVIRATVKPKEKSQDEASEDRSARPARTGGGGAGGGGAGGGGAAGSAGTAGGAAGARGGAEDDGAIG